MKKWKFKVWSVVSYSVFDLKPKYFQCITKKIILLFKSFWKELKIQKRNVIQFRKACMYIIEKVKFVHVKFFSPLGITFIRKGMKVNEVLLLPVLYTCGHHIVDKQLHVGLVLEAQTPCLSWPCGMYEGPNGFIHSRYLILWHTELRHVVGYNIVISGLTERVQNLVIILRFNGLYIRKSKKKKKSPHICIDIVNLIWLFVE